MIMIRRFIQEKGKDLADDSLPCDAPDFILLVLKTHKTFQEFNSFSTAFKSSLMAKQNS